MKILILKLGATGDVVRTTPLLEKLTGEIFWITAAKNVSLLNGLKKNLQSFSWEQKNLATANHYDLVINLEDTLEAAQFVQTLRFQKLFGAFLENDGKLNYSEDSRGWFDLSLISRFGKKRADELKLQNRRSYQDLVFDGLGFQFAGEKYFLPKPPQTDLRGDVAISPKAGHVWPMKNWAFYSELKTELEKKNLVVNVLPNRATLLEHLGDVKNHRVLVSGDSLPMHFALGVGTHCVTIFNCTSPWEIFDYSLQTKIVSPLLEKYFFKRDLEIAATTAVSREEVFKATLARVK
jgi:ADP-heptose:LPS heptosyltransferase